MRCSTVCGNYKVAYSGHNTQLENEFDHLDADAAAARFSGRVRNIIYNNGTYCAKHCDAFPELVQWLIANVVGVAIGCMLRCIVMHFISYFVCWTANAFQTKPKIFIGFCHRRRLLKLPLRMPTRFCCCCFIKISNRANCRCLVWFAFRAFGFAVPMLGMDAVFNL